MSGPHEFLARASAWALPALADHLWQSTLFAALVFALALLARRGPARTRHAVWLVALSKFALPPALFALLAAGAGLDASLFFTQAQSAETTSAPLALQLAVPVAALSSPVGTSAVVESAHTELYCALTLAWLAGGALILFVRRRRRREFLRALEAGREVYVGREFEAMERARRRLGLKRDARLWLWPHGTFLLGPGVWRTRAPVVVLPATLAAQLDEEELESLLLHELAHVERRDNLVARLQSVLTCVFWFCPPVWLVSRKVLEERERACDERVMAVGGASAPYASSILKVVRFCSGWNVAGVAGAAAGPNLRRRIEEIMRAKTNHERSAWARVLPHAAALAALALSAGAGVYSYAQSAGEGGGGRAVAPRQAGDGQGGARVSAGVQRRGASGAAAEVERAAESFVNYDNSNGSPLVITEAKMRMLTREGLRRADEAGAGLTDERAKADFFLTMPSVTVANYTAKTVREVGLGFVTDGRTNVIAGHPASIGPGESQTFRSEWAGSNIVMPGTFADVTVQVVWVEFTDGTQWGGRTRAPLPRDGAGTAHGVAPDAAGRGKSRGEGTSAGVASGAGGGTGEGAGGGAGAGGGTSAVSAGGGVASGGGEGAGGGVAAGGGSEVRGGILNQRVRSAPKPVYPAEAKAARVRGTVAVRIVIDEEGNVISAEAVSGHPLLRAASVEAARDTKFAPTRLNGEPVKVTGHLTYNFVPDDKKDEQPRQ